MENIFNLGIPYLLVLVLPGFIYSSVRRFTIGQASVPVDAAEAIRILIRSFMVLAFTVLIFVPTGHADLIYGMVEKPVLYKSPLMLFGSAIQGFTAWLTFVVLPGVYGCIIGLAQRQGWSISGFLRRKLKNLAQVSDQATDQAIFASLNICKREDKTLIIGVRTTEGMLYGRFGSQSKLSHSGGYRDLYLEETWEEDAQGKLVKVPDASSILIKGSVIEALIFFYV